MALNLSISTHHRRLLLRMHNLGPCQGQTHVFQSRQKVHGSGLLKDVKMGPCSWRPRDRLSTAGSQLSFSLFQSLLRRPLGAKSSFWEISVQLTLNGIILFINPGEEQEQGKRGELGRKHAKCMAVHTVPLGMKTHILVRRSWNHKFKVKQNFLIGFFSCSFKCIYTIFLFTVFKKDSFVLLTALTWRKH